MVRPRLERMLWVKTADGLMAPSGSPAAPLSIAIDRSTESSVSGWPVRSTSIISLNSCLTRAMSARLPVAVTSLPRTWMSVSGKERSITLRRESVAPSRVTIGCFSGITIRAVDPSPPGALVRALVCAVSLIGSLMGWR